MSSINFEPWVGKNYATIGYKGKKVLVLGESHYCSNELAQSGRCHPYCRKELMDGACRLQTCDVVREAVYDYGGQSYLRCFVSFERAVVGKVLTQEERENFWNSVMFYNYIQFAQSGPRVVPRPEHWAASENAFVELLNIYKPDYIIVWGVRLYLGLPDFGGRRSEIMIDDNKKADVWIYPINGREIPSLKIHHPSAPSGKKWHYWHEVIEKFFNVY